MSDCKAVAERVLRPEGATLHLGAAWSWDIARYGLIEHAARLEQNVALNLAIQFGRDPVHILSLLSDVFWRVPIDARIRLLDEALWRTGLQDDVPVSGGAAAPSIGRLLRIGVVAINSFKSSGLIRHFPLSFFALICPFRMHR